MRLRSSILLVALLACAQRTKGHVDVPGPPPTIVPVPMREEPESHSQTLAFHCGDVLAVPGRQLSIEDRAERSATGSGKARQGWSERETMNQTFAVRIERVNGDEIDATVHETRRTPSDENVRELPKPSLAPWKVGSPKDLAKAFATLLELYDEELPFTVRLTPSNATSPYVNAVTFALVANAKLGPYGLAHKFRQDVSATGSIVLSKEGVLLDAQLGIVEMIFDLPPQCLDCPGTKVATRTTKRTYHVVCDP